MYPVVRHTRKSREAYSIFVIDNSQFPLKTVRGLSFVAAQERCEVVDEEAACPPIASRWQAALENRIAGETPRQHFIEYVQHGPDNMSSVLSTCFADHGAACRQAVLDVRVTEKKNMGSTSIAGS
jgi:hypothetical protein